jgi:DMSO reductase anchor subunit
MHPAPSIIAFTVLSGLGYGLAAVLGLGLLDPTALATKIAWGVSLALIVTGLSASTLHLGNPGRAWRALSQWRSSWLSREGVMAVVAFVPLLISAWVSIVDGRYLVLPGWIGALMAFGTVTCTAMIYGSLKSVDAWHTPLTPVCYLLFSAAGGLVLASFFTFCGGENRLVLPLLAALFLVVAWIAKYLWRRHMMETAPLSTPESATGLGDIGQVRLFERPHATENYLTREMGFRVARKHAAKLWVISAALGGAVPILILLALALAGASIGWAAALAAVVALLSHMLGMLCERWLFFAEARHAVMNYYGG